MAVLLPDIIGEYLDASQRFQTGGIQYGGYFEPDTIAPEQVSHLFLFLQNTFDAPLQVNIRVVVPQSGGFLKKGGPILKVQEPVIQLKLAGAEAGLLTLPVTTGEDVQTGSHPLTLELKTAVKGKPQRVRPPSARSKLNPQLIDSPVGLNLVSTLGATYTENVVKKAAFNLKIAGKPEPPERAPRLQHTYQTIWTRDRLDLFNQAIQEINSREVKFKQELNVEALFTTLYAESTFRLADAGQPLRIGEAIMLAKILTYCCHYFLDNPERRNGLLVPIWERALEAETDTTDVLQVIRTTGYYHVLKLSIAMSFGLVAKAVGKQLWPLVERQALANYVADCIEVGEVLDLDFLYLPLLMGGTLVCSKLKLPGEDPRHSLALMKKAYDSRVELFSDADMAQANKAFALILKKAMS